MNYGYSEPGIVILLDERDEKNRYSVQLYHQMAEMTDLKNKDVVEVGSGRGGGLEYISRVPKERPHMSIFLQANSNINP